MFPDSELDSLLAQVTGGDLRTRGDRTSYIEWSVEDSTETFVVLRDEWQPSRSAFHFRGLIGELAQRDLLPAELWVSCLERLDDGQSPQEVGQHLAAELVSGKEAENPPWSD